MEEAKVQDAGNRSKHPVSTGFKITNAVAGCAPGLPLGAGVVLSRMCGPRGGWWAAAAAATWGV
eukprot:2237755-Amphidinium_carterae.1